MATVCNHGGADSERTKGTKCNHTADHKNAAGVLLGSWIEVEIGSTIRIECVACKKLYGVIERKTMSPEEMQAAYLEQQRRLACPGCGEEPFLG